jgi:aminoglycoside phosphotransferase (APT) family kinase protein
MVVIRADPRVQPLVTLDRTTIEAMLAPVAGGVPLGSVTPVGGGLVNTLLRVTTGDGQTFALRVSPHARHIGRVVDMETELDLLARLVVNVPVPQPVVIDASGAQFGVPFVAYPWIDGVTLNDCRRAHAKEALRSLAEPLGALLASVTTTAIDPALRLPRTTIAGTLDETSQRLHSNRVVSRLGTSAIDGLRRLLEAVARRLLDADVEAVLVHGDFGGRNIIVRRADGATWVPSGVLDWELAHVGSRLWDIGSLFRYWRRYDDEFQAAFARGYRGVGGILPDEWWRLSRVVDATRLVTILDEERELPSVFDDCREIVGDLLEQCAPFLPSGASRPL